MNRIYFIYYIRMASSIKLLCYLLSSVLDLLGRIPPGTSKCEIYASTTNINTQHTDLWIIAMSPHRWQILPSYNTTPTSTIVSLQFMQMYQTLSRRIRAMVSIFEWIPFEYKLSRHAGVIKLTPIVLISAVNYLISSGRLKLSRNWFVYLWDISVRSLKYYKQHKMRVSRFEIWNDVLLIRLEDKMKITSYYYYSMRITSAPAIYCKIRWSRSRNRIIITQIKWSKGNLPNL